MVTVSLDAGSIQVTGRVLCKTTAIWQPIMFQHEEEMTMAGAPEWFRDAVFYQIFPATFQDSNGDGIGDLPGVISRLDYLAELGVTGLWLSPIYDSPFNDAGYDVRDFYTVAERYGTNEDFRELCTQATERGMRVIVDFVPGHTSIDHPWFLESCKHENNKYSNWYIWTDDMWETPKRADGSDFNSLRGFGEREGTVATNFFWSQPKLNFGYISPDPKRREQLPTDHPDVCALAEEMKNVMRFWLDLGASGFRIDSCGSLILGDADPSSRHMVREFRQLVQDEYPDALLVGEWKFNPQIASEAGLHATFMLHNQRPFMDLYPLPGWENHDTTPYFDPGGRGDCRVFIEHYTDIYEGLEDKGFWCMFSGNHDYRRLACDRPERQARCINALVLTMPGTPFIYYGSETGMLDPDGLPSKEGAYRRTGCRTPMQWDDSANAGFSTAAAENLYLPIHPDADRPTVAKQAHDAGSLLSVTKRLVALHRELPQFRSTAPFVALPEAGPKVLVFLRGEAGDQVLVAINAGPETQTVTLPQISSAAETLLDDGGVLGDGKLTLAAQSFIVVKV